MQDNSVRVTSVQRLCVHDGPGVRTTVFLKGCYLHCPWCCNPETINYEENNIFDRGTCLMKSGSVLCNKCELKGGNIKKILCPVGSYEKTYTDYSVDELYALLVKDKSSYTEGGGITFSGGEPLMQAKAILPLLAKLHSVGVNIALETSLYAPHENLRLVLDYVDFMYVDVKAQYGFIVNRNADTSECDFARNNALVRSVLGCNVNYRMVMLGDILDRSDTIITALNRMKISSIELLPYHSLGKNKYLQLGMHFNDFETPEDIQIVQFQKILMQQNISSTTLKL